MEEGEVADVVRTTRSAWMERRTRLQLLPAGKDGAQEGHPLQDCLLAHGA